MSIGCKIKKSFKRPSREVVELFKDIPVPNIDDCMDRTGAIDGDIRPVGMGKGQLLGTAFPLRVPAGDNLMFHAAMDMAEPGDVFVIDADGATDRAIFGELMASYCKVLGVKGIIVDGAIRDCAGLAGMKDFMVYAKGVTPDGPYKNGPGEIGYPVVIGGKIVNPGDIIVGDDDGVVVIDPKDAVELAAKARKVIEKETKMMDEIINQHTNVRPWVQVKLDEIGVEYED